MWQRIQTVFLAIAVLSLIVAVFFPIWGFQEGERNHQLYALHYMISENGNKVHQYLPYGLTGVLFIAAITIGVIQIGKYKNRMLQIKLGTLNSLILVGGYGAAVYFGSSFIKSLGGTYGVGIWLPAVAVFFNWLAMRFIRKDEKLVRDSDRLR